MRDKILDSISDLIYENNWAGACYASTAIAHTLLTLHNISSTPCIGVVGCLNGEVFDHAWLEIDGLVYDLAMPFPISHESRVYDYFDDRFGFRGIKKHPEIFFGLDRNLDSEAIEVASNFEFIMKHSPFFNQNINYWDLTRIVASNLKRPVTVNGLKAITKTSAWSIKRYSSSVTIA